MIQKFRSKALELAFAGNTSKLTPQVVPTVQKLLDALDGAQSLEDLTSLSGFHELQGDRQGTYSVTVTHNWRVTFRLSPETVTNPDTGEEEEIFNVTGVGFEDYH